MIIPATAAEIAVRATVDSNGQPSCRVTFTLTSDELDQFCRDGQVNRPLRVVTIPSDYLEIFAYTGDSSTGLRWSGPAQRACSRWSA